MTARYVPEGYHTVTPYLVVHGVAGVIDFLKRTFGAEESFAPISRPDGSIMHAEVRIGDSRVMMGEPTGEREPMPAMLYVYVSDTDAAYERALAAGGTSVMEPADQSYGDRNAGVEDPAGNHWWIATHKEDLSPEEARGRVTSAAR